MNAQPQLGAILVVLGGLLQGSFALPMKRLGKWRWENIWLVYSVAGLLIVPSILALATVPGLGGIYGSASMGTLALVALFGFGWGLGSTLFGQGISRVGFALGFAVILGVTSVLGSLLPLLINDPSKIATTQGLYLIAGIVLAVVGIICCAIAGAMREKATKTATDAAAGKSGFTTGLIICIAAGILSPMLNFAFVYGKPLTDAGLANGANPTQASNSIWVLGLA
ncbi:MAG: rhamnose/proton symporter RhaT, partial [Acidobacteria bacterium]|nr:rhamnose/proton symporter RhaT [Acidobacteriota bacterium]